MQPSPNIVCKPHASHSAAHLPARYRVCVLGVFFLTPDVGCGSEERLMSSHHHHHRPDVCVTRCLHVCSEHVSVAWQTAGCRVPLPLTRACLCRMSVFNTDSENHHTARALNKNVNTSRNT